MTNHPKDRHVLAAAAHARVGTIVTYNTKDFPPLSLAPHSIKTLEPSSGDEHVPEDHDSGAGRGWGRRESLIWPPRGYLYTLGALYLALVATGFFAWLRFEYGLEPLKRYYLPYYPL